jgi:predicted ATP-dependent endonuclease of OLD family
MQRKLIDVMIEFPNHQYFITTHSNHFLDLTLDYGNISIYKFNGIEKDKEQRFVLEQVESGDSSILKSL